jgi:hypothetical protein
MAKPARPPCGEVAPEKGDPNVVGVADLLLLVHAWQAKGQARIYLDAFGIHQVHVKGWIGHDEVATSGKVVLVMVVGDGFGYLPLQSVHGEVHLGDADGFAVLFLPIEDNLLSSIAALMLDEVARLHKHAARAAGRIEHRAVVGFDDVHDGLHQ